MYKPSLYLGSKFHNLLVTREPTGLRVDGTPPSPISISFWTVGEKGTRSKQVLEHQKSRARCELLFRFVDFASVFITNECEFIIFMAPKKQGPLGKIAVLIITTPNRPRQKNKNHHPALAQEKEMLPTIHQHAQVDCCSSSWRRVYTILSQAMLRRSVVCIGISTF